MTDLIVATVVAFFSGTVLTVLVLAFLAGKQDGFEEEERMYEEWKNER